MQELAADIERQSLLAYLDCPPNVRDSLPLNSFVDAMRDPEIQQALRIADHKDLKSALVYAMKFESAKQASKILKYVREAVIMDSASGLRTENKDKLDNVMGALKNLHPTRDYETVFERS